MEHLKLIDRKLKYKAHRVKVYEDTVKTPEGDKYYYDFVENRNGSGVLLVDDEDKLIFVRQYRNVIDDMDLEIPAGCAEISDITDNASGTTSYSGIISTSETASVSGITSGLTDSVNADFNNPENPFYLCALRESEEETGLIPGKLIFVNYIIAAVGLFSERTAVYIGLNLKKGTVNRDEDEYIEVVKLSLEEALRYISEGKIHDSKTIIAIYAYALMKKQL